MVPPRHNTLDESRWTAWIHGATADRRRAREESGFLDLGNSRLTEVPAERFELTHLRSLNLGARYEVRNALATLPEGLNASGNRVALFLAGNPVSDLGPLRDSRLAVLGLRGHGGEDWQFEYDDRKQEGILRGSDTDWQRWRRDRRPGAGRDPERGRNPVVAEGSGGKRPANTERP
ncbi:MAG: leucine-rich repeat domain-containing protein [Chromatiales bacterium]|nr:leucine-rich repeat domain-containing protein [Chromatiales bacterium]